LEKALPSFHLRALRDVDGKPDGLTACRRDLFHDCVDPVFTPRSYDNLRSVSRKKHERKGDRR
jgi:hypothetical protein